MPDMEMARSVKDRILGLVPLSFTLVLISALAALLISACGSEDANEGQFTPAEATAAAASAPTINVKEVVHLLFYGYAHSGQGGIATLTAKGDHTEIFINISPSLDGHSVKQTAYIRSTGCYSGLGPEMARLDDVVNGKSTSLSDLSLAALLEGGLSIKIHRAGEVSDEFAACADIPARDQSITIELFPKGPEGLYGSATLTQMKAQDVANKEDIKEGESQKYLGDHVQVMVRIDGLEGTHSASVHLRTCENGSRIKAFELSEVVDGVSVGALMDNLKGVIYRGTNIDVHSADEQSTPIVCGDIVRPE